MLGHAQKAWMQVLASEFLPGFLIAAQLRQSEDVVCGHVCTGLFAPH